jgi:hypothetical protein
MKDRTEYYKKRYADQKAAALAAKLALETAEEPVVPSPSTPPVIRLIEQTLNRPGSQFITARARWRRLPDVEKREVIEDFKRHGRACRNVGISPEPAWIVDTLAIKFNSQP